MRPILAGLGQAGETIGGPATLRLPAGLAAGLATCGCSGLSHIATPAAYTPG